ncbi:MAG: aspartate-semialdehyde dehydrogenase [Gemmatimonadales bacterium]|nr:MAG: aspartate-semialdehyde dehydrogenase [Gemmatimonadales bacterium]
MHSAERIPVTVLGATGLVGRRLVGLLVGHPWFELRHVAASDRTVGQAYGSACRSRQLPLPREVEGLIVQPCEPGVCDTPLVFSALDATAAARIEPRFAERGKLVVSNASVHRMEPDVPLVIPEINPDALDLLHQQRRTKGWEGGIVCNPNCVVAIAALAAYPLHRAAGIRRMEVTTLQAVSGAGHPGIASVDILGNVIPWIAGEEEKIRHETARVLGADLAIGVQVNRVPVMHGHMACLAIECGRAVSEEEARAVYAGYRVPAEIAMLPSSPPEALVVLEGEDRPQPALDADLGDGMSVSVGRIRADAALGIRLVACGHNLVRGAAGAALLNAELAVRRGFVNGCESRFIATGHAVSAGQ